MQSPIFKRKPSRLANKKRDAQVVKSVCPAFCFFFAQDAVPERLRCAQGKRSKP